MQLTHLAIDHIIGLLSGHREKGDHTPLFIGIQGPQGIGKSTLTSSLVEALAVSHQLTAVALSIDDFYLSHSGLASLAGNNPGNKLLNGRGEPGTHDLPLISHVLQGLVRINDGDAQPVIVPRFDKSLHDGQGDRVPIGSTINGPVDIVIFEGWCMGFHPLPLSTLRQRYLLVSELPSSSSRPEATLEREIVRAHTLQNIEQINNILRSYRQSLYPFFSGFIQLAPPPSRPYSYIYRWRLQQEHSMKAQNGGRGMNDDEVKGFIDRYIPGYIFFSEGVLWGYNPSEGSERDDTSTAPPWIGHGLRIILSLEREVEEVQHF
ncbi:hypothetical protein BS47DRAFT_1339420 [Hydnum rufescens UP504]|uniref:P-loop containing nucleoside triphosphate hydrolase protein n=1 Tax=Hydnum rufescens UP504 TaxID=1448309 RepID=A0A9P6B784_9AGAM|nr:hypothetical protein BS47DRAFT_1339420 [Hydnum rufescens UP504]